MAHRDHPSKAADPRHPRESLRARVGRKLDEVKTPYALFLALQRLFRPGLFEYVDMYVLSLDLSRLDMTPPDDPAIREITAADENELDRIDEPRETVLDRFRRGQRLWIYERDGRILAFDWIAGREKTLSTWLILGSSPGAFWGHFLKVQSDCRGMGLGPTLRGQVCRVYARAGYTHLLSTVDIRNRNSISYQLKAGAEPYGRVRFFSLLGVTLLHHGTHWRLGLWSALRPLRISLEDVEVPGLSIPPPRR